MKNEWHNGGGRIGIMLSISHALDTCVGIIILGCQTVLILCEPRTVSTNVWIADHIDIGFVDINT
jgi:hypothetical protein